jgi:hypothetical protein
VIVKMVMTMVVTSLMVIKLKNALIFVLIEIPLGAVTPASCSALNRTEVVIACVGSPATSSGRIISTPERVRKRKRRRKRRRKRKGSRKSMRKQ